MSRLILLLLPMLVLAMALPRALGAPPAPGTLNAADFGVRPDGKDVTAALQKALDAAAKAGGGTVALGPGHFTLVGSLHIPSGVTLQGTWQTPHHSQGLTGTVLMITGGRGQETGPAAIELVGNTAVRGLTLAWPDQRLETITPYPFALHGQGMHVTIEDVTLVNAYQGIALGPEGNELHIVRDVFGCPLKTGVFVDNCTDVGRLEDVHWNPHYWSRSGLPGAPQGEQAIFEYQRQHLDGFVFGRSDWEYVTNTFVFGARNGYRFIQTAHGSCNGQFTGIGSDGGPCAVRLEAAQPMGLLFTNGQFVAMGGEHPAQIIADETFNAAAQFLNCAFWGPSDHIATLGGRGAYLFQSCNFRDWRDKSVGAIHATGAGSRLSVTGCLFGSDGPSVTADKGVAESVVSGNLGQSPHPTQAETKIVP